MAVIRSVLNTSEGFRSSGLEQVLLLPCWDRECWDHVVDKLPLSSESSLLLGRRPRFMISPGDSRQPLSQEAIRRAGRRASNKQTPAAAATREQGRRRAAATPRRGLCAGLRRGDGAGPPPRGPEAPGTVRRRSGSDKEPPWGRRPAPSLRRPPLACAGGRAAKVGPGANQHLPTCRVGSCPGEIGKAHV